MNLVIGIGNDLRGDDGVGPHVVSALPPRPNLEAITVHQLVPELADRLRIARRVLFVDACIDSDALRLDPVWPSAHRGVGHTCSAAALLGWTEAAYGRSPEAWLLRIPASRFDPGVQMSVATTACVPEALERVESWLLQSPQPVPVMNEEEA